MIDADLPGAFDGIDTSLPAARASTDKPSDLDVCLLFEKLFGADYRYDRQRRKFFKFDGTRWALDLGDHSLADAKLLSAHCLRLAAEASEKRDDDDAEFYVKLASICRSERVLTAALRLFAATEGVAIDSADFDRNPLLFNLANGTIDLTTGQRRPHCRKDLITKISPVRFDPSAQAKRWEQFIDEVFLGDVDAIAYAQDALGYSLTGETKEQCLFVLKGSGANGKTTFLEVAKSVMGDYALASTMSTFIASKGKSASNDVARLKGARFVSASEADEGSSLAESTIKQLTGGDSISARYLYAEYDEFVPHFKIWLSVNHLPTIQDDGYAIWRRIRLVEFDAVFEGAKRDKHLKEKLLAESSGILNWMLAGCARWMERGLITPQSVEFATRAYRSEMASFDDFLAACVVDESGARTSSTAMCQAYAAWAASQNERPLTVKAVSVKLTERGLRRIKNRDGNFFENVGIRAVTQ